MYLIGKKTVNVEQLHFPPPDLQIREINNAWVHKIKHQLKDNPYSVPTRVPVLLDPDTKKYTSDSMGTMLSVCFDGEENWAIGGDIFKTLREWEIPKLPSHKKSNGSVHKWLVFASACVVMVVPMGIFYSLGALFVPFMSAFQASRTEASLIQSVAVAVSLSTGFVHGFLMHRFGMVKTGLAGSTLASLGLGVSYFATSVPYLVFTIGIATSVGSICLYIVSSAAVGQYFSGKRALILLSIVNASSGVGGMVFPFILAFLYNKFNLQGTLLICAGLVMNTIPGAILWTQPQRKCKSVLQTNTKSEDTINIKDGNTNGQDNCNKMEIGTTQANCTHSSLSYHRSHLESNTHKEMNNQQSVEVVIESSSSLPGPTQFQRITDHEKDKTRHEKSPHFKENTTTLARNIQQSDEVVIECRPSLPGPTKIHRIDDHKKDKEPDKTLHFKENTMTLAESIKHLVKHKSFVFFIVGLGFSYPPIMVLITFIVDAFQDSGLSTDDANIGLLLLNVCGIIGRIIPGLMMQSRYIKTMTVPVLASVMAAGSMAGLILTKSLHLKLLFSSLSGVAYGMFVSCFSVTALDIVGADHLGNAIGLAFTCNGLANIAAGPVSGFIRDSTGSYMVVFLLASGVQFVAIFLFVIAQVFLNISKTTSSRSQTTKL